MARTGPGAIALAAIFTLGSCGGGDDAAPNQAAVNSGSPAPLTHIAAPNNGDWTQMVRRTSEGGYLMGNPEAPVKLLEYASVTCPHCAEFAEAATDPLVNIYVRSGQVSYEYRPFMIFPSDPGVFALLQCQGPTPYFRLLEQLYETQREWSGRLQSLPPEQLQQTQSMSATDRAEYFVRAAGLDQFFRQRGMPESRIDSCLADPTTLEQLADVTARGAEQDQVQGTPTFHVNGEKIDADTWPEVEQRLRSAIGG